MKNNLSKTVRFNIGSGFNPATPGLLRQSGPGYEGRELLAKASPAVEYDPKPPPMPEAWYKELMAVIYRIGPLRKPSLPMNNKTTGRTGFFGAQS